MWVEIRRTFFPCLGCALCREDFLLIILLQLKISLNKDCPHLKLGLGWDTEEDVRQWGRCRSGMKGVGINVMRKSFSDKLSSYSTLKRSVFGSNLHRAIKTALGDSRLVQSDAISLMGYIIDFEVLLDKNGEPIPVSILWKYRTKDVLSSSLGIKTSVKRRGRRENISDKLVESMKHSEENGDHDDGCHSNIYADAMPRCGHEVPFNLASDWGQRFCGLPRPAARKIMIEGDGIFHFPRNDRDHQLGHTVLKRRHAEMLGWEMINVSTVQPLALIPRPTIVVGAGTRPRDQSYLDIPKALGCIVTREARALLRALGVS